VAELDNRLNTITEKKTRHEERLQELTNKRNYIEDLKKEGQGEES